MSKKIAFTTRLTRDDVAGIMEAMMDGMREGHLKVQKSDETLEMAVPRVIDLEVRAALEKDRARCILEVSWRPNREENPDVPDMDIPQMQEATEVSAGAHARASIREAAQAARVAAKTAGLALEKTARAASVLVRERADRRKADASGEGKDAKGILSQVTAKVGAAAKRARKAVRGIVGETGKDGEPVERPQQEIVPEPVPAESVPSFLASVPEVSEPESSEPESAPRRKTGGARTTPARKKSPAPSRAKASAAASSGSRPDSTGTGKRKAGKAKPEA
jgi:amphi-Trp domain-containing protein